MLATAYYKNGCLSIEGNAGRKFSICENGAFIKNFKSGIYEVQNLGASALRFCENLIENSGDVDRVENFGYPSIIYNNNLIVSFKKEKVRISWEDVEFIFTNAKIRISADRLIFYENVKGFKEEVEKMYSGLVVNGAKGEFVRVGDEMILYVNGEKVMRFDLDGAKLVKSDFLHITIDEVQYDELIQWMREKYEKIFDYDVKYEKWGREHVLRVGKLVFMHLLEEDGRYVPSFAVYHDGNFEVGISPERFMIAYSERRKKIAAVIKSGRKFLLSFMKNNRQVEKFLKYMNF